MTRSQAYFKLNLKDVSSEMFRLVVGIHRQFRKNDPHLVNRIRATRPYQVRTRKRIGTVSTVN